MPTHASTSRVVRDVIVVGAIWGASVFLQRVALSEIDPLPMVTLRLLAAVAFFVPVIRRVVRGVTHQPRLLLHLGVAGLLNPAATGILSALALRHASSGVVAVLIALGPVVTALLASTLLDEAPLRPHQGAGLAVALAGVIVLVATRTTGLARVAGSPLRGQGMALAVAGLTALAAVYSRQHLVRADPVAAVAGQITASLLVVALVTLSLGGRAALGTITLQGWLAVALSGAIGLSASFILFLRMIAQHGPTASSLALYLMPVTASLLGALFLHESITGPMTVGSILVLAGVFLFTRR
jgi:drug/metabolite transporter (DMT)-like permease